MEITGLITAVIIGAVIGGLGRAVVPGRQRISIIMTVLVGMVAALLGTAVTSVVGLADTAGIDWIELFTQIGFAGAGIAVLGNAEYRQRILNR